MRQSLRCEVNQWSRVNSVGANFTDGGQIEFQVVEEIAAVTMMSVCKVRGDLKL